MWLSSKTRTRRPNKFQSTHLHEVWLFIFWELEDLVPFQSTHLHEVWQNLNDNAFYRNQFQSTHLHEVWPSLTSITSITTSFNPHTYMRCDFGKNEIGFARLVSIHTPTWGVTITFCNIFLAQLFQSTHLHEVWHRIQYIGSYHRCFNPHTYMRCDAFMSSINVASSVSIHTPTWGVTRSVLVISSESKFQSTHLHEVWLFWYNVVTYFRGFNPHTYMRCDLQHPLCHAYLWCFNPHTYMRCDYILQDIQSR